MFSFIHSFIHTYVLDNIAKRVDRDVIDLYNCIVDLRLLLSVCQSFVFIASLLPAYHLRRPSFVVSDW